jgi:predicted NAD/FAD-dependent oxidoreductase
MYASFQTHTLMMVHNVSLVLVVYVYDRRHETGGNWASFLVEICTHDYGMWFITPQDEQHVIYQQTVRDYLKKMIPLTY